VRDNDGGDAAAAAAAAAAVVGPVSGVGAELAEAGGNNAQGGGVEVGDMKDEEGTRAGGCQSLGRCVGVWVRGCGCGCGCGFVVECASERGCICGCKCGCGSGCGYLSVCVYE
jgi:hypothetical protein